RVQDVFDALQGWILFGGEFFIAREVVVGLFQNLPVRRGEIFRQDLNHKLPIDFDAVNGLDLRFDVSPDDFGIFSNDRARRTDAYALIGELHVDERIGAPLLRYDVIGGIEHGALDSSLIQGAQPLRHRADLHDGDIFSRNESEPPQRDARNQIGLAAESGDGDLTPFELLGG